MSGGYFEWTKKDVERAITNAVKEGKSVVALAMQHNTHQNELQVIEWVKEAGYAATHDWERVTVNLLEKISDEGLKEWLTPISKGELLHWLSEFGFGAKVDVGDIMKYIRSGELDMSKEDCEKFFTEEGSADESR